MSEEPESFAILEALAKGTELARNIGDAALESEFMTARRELLKLLRDAAELHRSIAELHGQLVEIHSIEAAAGPHHGGPTRPS